MKEKEYQHHLRPLHAELVALQEWVKTSGAKICVVFEGRDTAGKGGTTKAIIERVSPRVFRVIALPAPTTREKSQMYVQRYVPHLPAAGEVVIFDRSWYNRAGAERVMGFCTEEQANRFLTLVPAFENGKPSRKRLFLRQYRSARRVDGEPVGPGRTPGCGDVPESSGAQRMNATLFLPGVVCILARMVGGGLKTAEVEVPALRTWGGQAAPIGLGLVLVWLSFFMGDQI